MVAGATKKASFLLLACGVSLIGWSLYASKDTLAGILHLRAVADFNAS